MHAGAVFAAGRVGGRWLAGRMAALPMFPLGSVLFPYMPLRLRVFEERYLIMLADLLKTEEATLRRRADRARP